MLHTYITQVQDVRPDGNCGFRAIAACLGLHQDDWSRIQSDLLYELYARIFDTEYTRIFDTEINELQKSLNFFGLGFAPPQHWMIMPNTGLLIANRYGVIVHCLSIQGSVTCFPLWFNPLESQQHVAIAIAYVHGNHYVKVKLQGWYPKCLLLCYYGFTSNISVQLDRKPRIWLD